LVSDSRRLEWLGCVAFIENKNNNILIWKSYGKKPLEKRNGSQIYTPVKVV
jgi:hypothetical protein